MLQAVGVCGSGRDSLRNLRVGHSERTAARLDEDRTVGTRRLDVDLE